MSHFLKKFFCVIFVSAAVVGCGGGDDGGQAPKGGGSNGPPALSDLNAEVDAQSGAVTWAWSCPDSLAEGQVCKFRHAITQSASHVFADTDDYSAAADNVSISFDGTHDDFDQGRAATTFTYNIKW